MPPFSPFLYQLSGNTITRLRKINFFRINVSNNEIESNWNLTMLPIPEGLRHWPSSTVWNLPLAGSRPDAGQRMKIGDNASRSFFSWSFWDFFASDRAGPHVLNIPHGSSSRTTAHFDFPHFFFSYFLPMRAFEY